jgi:nucleoside permease NupC
VTDLIQYIIGLVLCVVVAFIYSSMRKQTPRETLHDGLVVLAWMLAALILLGVFGYVGSRLF